MESKRPYIIVAASDSVMTIFQFMDAVSEKMAEGYKPIGNVGITVHQNGYWYYSQAMVNEKYLQQG